MYTWSARRKNKKHKDNVSLWKKKIRYHEFLIKSGKSFEKARLFRRRSKEKNIPESILLRKEDLHGLTIDAARRRMQGLFKAFFVNRPAIFPASWKKGAYTGAPVFENAR